MELEVIHYPHPTLRYQSKPIQRVDAELKSIVSRMFELMYEHKGIGLAANQVNLPLQMFVINLQNDDDGGEELVFINPVISMPKGSSVAEEGCLSIPGVYGKVARPDTVRVQAYNLQGEAFDQVVDGLFSRAIQHETDHLNGVVFPDRMTETEIKEIEDELDDFQTDFNSRRTTGSIPDDDTIAKHWANIESKYC